jgi:hypothetical protein
MSAKQTTKQSENAAIVDFKAKLFKIGSWTVLVLPIAASKKLPSRGMVMVKGTIDGFDFQAPLEPDGRGSHWLEVTKTMREGAGIDSDDVATLVIEPTKAWPEPKIPADLKAALAAEPQVTSLWQDITPMARWDWLRWIASTGRTETRKHRIEVAFSKLKAGERRPCCFNRTMCTVTAVSKSGVLLEPASA